MQRVSVVGTSGSGKSTLARALAEAIGAPHVELDSIYHRAGWNALPPQEFRDRVTEVVAGERWVVDGNYSTARDIVWEAADTVVWVDMPRALVLRRIVTRSVGRAWTREELWNGNRERWLNLLDPRPSENVVLWSTLTYGRNRRRYSAAMEDERWRDLDFVRLRTPDEVARWLEDVRGSADLGESSRPR